MAIITDVEKLRPELKSVSDAELERRMTELRMEMERREQEAKRAKVEHVVSKANEHMQNIIAGLRFLDEHGLLSEDVKAAHTSAAGVFTPHLRYKQVDADRVLARMSDAPVKKTRRKKTAS